MRQFLPIARVVPLVSPANVRAKKPPFTRTGVFSFANRFNRSSGTNHAPRTSAYWDAAKP